MERFEEIGYLQIEWIVVTLKFEKLSRSDKNFGYFEM